MSAQKQAIEITQDDFRRLKERLSSFLKTYWDSHAKATPEQIAAANSVTIAIDEAVAKLEILKEKMQ
jgi:hypothetical protein